MWPLCGNPALPAVPLGIRRWVILTKGSSALCGNPALPAVPIGIRRWVILTTGSPVILALPAVPLGIRRWMNFTSGSPDVARSGLPASCGRLRQDRGVSPVVHSLVPASACIPVWLDHTTAVSPPSTANFTISDSIRSPFQAGRWRRSIAAHFRRRKSRH